MPTYVYACPVHKKRRKEVIHSVSDEPEILCSCGKQMQRVPQVFMWYRNPQITLMEKLDKRHEIYLRRKEWKKKHGRKRVRKDNQERTSQPA